MIDDVWAFSLVLIHIGLIFYCLRYTPRMECSLRCGWSYFIAMLAFNFLNRILFGLHCWDESDPYPLQHVLFTLSSYCLFMFVYKTGRRIAKRTV